MSRVNENHLFAAMRVVEDAQDERLKFDNVGPAESTATMRRGLRLVLDKVYTDAWDAGYAAALMDEAAGREAEREAARRSAGG